MTVRTWRHALAGVLVVAALGALLSQALRETASGDPTGDARLPAPHKPPAPETRQPPQVQVRVVPSVTTFPEVRHAATPEVEALAARLVTTATPRIHKGERGEDTPDLDDSDPPHLDPSGVPPWSFSTFPSTFDGLGQNQNQNVTPPDPHGAVGPDHVVSVMNITIAWYEKDGTLINSSFLRDFFVDSLASSIIADPRVMYDDHEDRWVVSTLEITTNPWTSRVLLAVSDTGDPGGSWTHTSIDTLLTIDNQQTFGDYPALGLGGQALYVSTNQYTTSTFYLMDARIFAVDKGVGSGGLYDGGSASVSVLDPPGAAFNFSLSPAKVYGAHPDPTVGTYLASYNGLMDRDTLDAYLQVFALTDPLTSPRFVQEFVNMGQVDSFELTPPVPQWSGGKPLDNGGRLLQSNTVWRDGFLYASTELTPVSGPDAGEGTVHWVQMSATAPGATTVFDQGDVGAEDIALDTRTFWPSVAVNANGDLGITFSISGPNIHPGAGFALRAVTDPAGTTRPTEILRSGVASYVFLDGNRNRWGDYTGVDADPSTGCLWSFNEYAMGWNTWGTAWGEMCADWTCGDGNLDPGETCDPPGGGAGLPEECRAGCTFCGDGNLEARDGELCDDGNNVAGDGCAEDCTREHCGDGFVFGPETCDPPELPAGMPEDCRADCTSCGDGSVNGNGNLIANGDFESGTLFGWRLDNLGSGTFGIRVPDDMVPLSGWPTQPNPGGGAFYAVSDSRDPGTQAMAQSFTVPANATSVIVEFEMFVNNWNSPANPADPPLPNPGTFVNPAGLDHTTPAPNQHARVDILEPGFDPFETSPEALALRIYRGADALSPPAMPYTSYSRDVTGFLTPGETYVLRFASTQNQSALNLGVDNVRILVTPAEGCDDGNNDAGDDCQSFCRPCPEGIFPVVLAMSKTRFGWGETFADATWVVGDLATVASLTGTQLFEKYTNAVDAPGTPPQGSGRFYVFRFDCAGATWSSGGTGEVGDRDLLLP
jgi:cysteine-rich repeat protein